MPLEIERKFLVNGDFHPFITSTTYIMQGYLSSVPERTVRIRIKDDKSFITIKGKNNQSGVSRYEWEKEIPVEEARELMSLCEPGIIEKKRHVIPNSSLFFEVDEFMGYNSGLIIAEIELPTEETLFEKPSWLGREVTGDVRFYNSYLSKNPYAKWKLSNL
ncbi:CYTH domain-containing protein [Paludibacter jiangxiensis]|uniref:Adenylate cyclase n=1 Tax=Paludibacter jiangxiensis TaxID=681398 RepID=A0A170Y1B6_9BACT|nr:CYTH domain-containing protein [Paludibacter jiangxiensis]GAT61422.1 adenylate cyclase [Paludibacter jiangxiensis]